MIISYPENTVSVSNSSSLFIEKRSFSDRSSRSEATSGVRLGPNSSSLFIDKRSFSDRSEATSGVRLGPVSHGDSATDTICISIVDERIKREFIFKKLCLLNIGYIHKLTEVPNKYQPGYKRVYIRIRWNTEPKTIGIRNILSSGQTVKFVYDFPWFWVITQL